LWAGAATTAFPDWYSSANLDGVRVLGEDGEPTRQGMNRLPYLVGYIAPFSNLGEQGKAGADVYPDTSPQRPMFANNRICRDGMEPMN